MERHTGAKLGDQPTQRSCNQREVGRDSPCEGGDPTPGVTRQSESPLPGIPLKPDFAFNHREFVAERVLMQFLLDDRARSRRAAAAVMKRFSERHGLAVFRLGRTRLYRQSDFFQALANESGVRLAQLLRRVADFE